MFSLCLDCTPIVVVGDAYRCAKINSVVFSGKTLVHWEHGIDQFRLGGDDPLTAELPDLNRLPLA